MSDKWEIVGSKRQKPKPKKEEPKVEEILPSHQYQNYSNSLKLALNKEQRKIQIVKNNNVGVGDNLKKGSSKQQVIGNKQQNIPANKQTPPQKKPNPSIPHKPKPKNIETGLTAIDLNDFVNTLESYKASFPNSHLLWLQRLSTYLSTNINIETDPTFTGKALLFPSVAVPNALKDIIYETLENAGDSTIQYFFDQSLTSLAVDMSKNQPYNGHKILLQLIALRWPSVCSNSLAKKAILLNSYVNRSSIGLSLLWAIGQGGFRDLTVGLRVWQNIMVPVWEIKAYRKYICEYVGKILQKNDCGSLLQNEFFTIFDTLTQGVQRDYQKVLNENASDVMVKYIRSNPKVSNVFLRLFMRLKSVENSSLYLGLVECLSKEDDCLKIWKMNYKKHISESNMLLSYLNKQWKKLPKSPNFGRPFKEFLSNINEINKSMSSVKLENEVNESNELIRNLQEKSYQKKSSSSSSCKWCLGSLLLMISIGGLIAYDTNTYGGGVFAKSKTGSVLKDMGALPYVEIAWTKTLSTSARGYQWAEKNVPVYAERTCTVLKPYAELSRDIGIVVLKAGQRGVLRIWDYVVEKSPYVVNTIDQYVPGLVTKIQDASIKAWDVTKTSSINVYNFFKTQVFVGRLSPESLCGAFNHTRNVAAQYYSWFHKKVDTYAKIQ